MARRGGDKIFQKKKEEQKKSDFQRLKDNKSKRSGVIIACEDISSAPTYFRMIVQKLIEDKKITPDSFVIADHNHTNPSGVLDDLKNHKCNNGKTYKDFEHKWIVIDRDIERVNGGGHLKKDFNNTIQNAKRLKVEVAYSNDAFELWYLLHFDYICTAIGRDDLNKRVIKKLQEKNPHKFSKLNKDNLKQANYTQYIYNELFELQNDAIRNATTLLESYGYNHNPENDNPSTRLHILVTLLNNLKS